MPRFVYECLTDPGNEHCQSGYDKVSLFLSYYPDVRCDTFCLTYTLTDVVLVIHYNSCSL